MIDNKDPKWYPIDFDNPGPFSSFSERLVFAREKANMSRSELSKLINKHHSIVGKYETGDRTPTDGNIFILAEALNVNPFWLKYGVPYYTGKLSNCSIYEFCTDKTTSLDNKKLSVNIKHNVDLALSKNDANSLNALYTLSELLIDNNGDINNIMDIITNNIKHS